MYWTEQQEIKGKSHFKDFEFDAIAAALQFIEALRARQRAGQAIRHITMSSENPDSIGKAGVADPPSNYQWKKRRI